MPRPQNLAEDQNELGWHKFNRVYNSTELLNMFRGVLVVDGKEYTDQNKIDYMAKARDGYGDDDAGLLGQWGAIYSTPFSFLGIGFLEEINGRRYFRKSVFADFLKVFPNKIDQYLQLLFLNYQLPHPYMKAALRNRYIQEGKQTKPFVVILKALVKLFELYGIDSCYLTRNELLNFLQFQFFDLNDNDALELCVNEIHSNRALNPNPFDVAPDNDEPYNRFIKQLSFTNIFSFDAIKISANINQVNRAKELLRHTSLNFIDPTSDDWANQYFKIMNPENYPVYKVRTIPQVTLADVPTKVKIASDDSSLLSNVITALSMGKSIILYGPPGTGKTFLATQIADLFGCGSERVTATDDWSTYDTIGGLVHKGNEGFKGKDGVIVSAIEKCYDAMESGKNGNWLIIDEINRCKIDAALGEMFTCLEPMSFAGLTPEQIESKWNHYYTLNLPFRDNADKQKLPIPRTFRLIGTLNTYDKHFLHNISFALTRRFAYIYVPVLKDWNKEVALIKKQVVSSIQDAFNQNIDATFATYNPLIEILKNFVWHIRGYSGADNANPVIKPENVIREIGTAQVIDTMKMCIGEIILYGITDDPEKIVCLDNSICANILPQLEGLGPKLDDDLIGAVSDFSLLNSANRLRKMKADNELF